MKNEKVIAIHQPSFFPWLGFFNKIARSDVFVILDNVQYPKTGGYWANRVKIIVNGEPAWITMPIVRSYRGFRKISEMEIDNNKRWREKLIRTVLANYQKTDFCGEVFPIIESLILFKTGSLLEFNLNTINRLCRILDINSTNIILASELDIQGKSTELIAAIVKSLNGTEYISGMGAKKYLKEEILANAGIKLTYQFFNHPVYKQSNSQMFIGGLSILDPLMNCGIEGVRVILNDNADKESM
jgi:hypothetical protein